MQTTTTTASPTTTTTTATPAAGNEACFTVNVLCSEGETGFIRGNADNTAGERVVTTADLRLGDFHTNRGYRIVLSVDLSPLSGLTIREATLQLKRTGAWGEEALADFGSPQMDLSLAFSGNVNLQASDFNAPALLYDIGLAAALPTRDGDHLSMTVNPVYLPVLNLGSKAQFRLRLPLDTNNDDTLNTIKFSHAGGFAPPYMTLRVCA